MDRYVLSAKLHNLRKDDAVVPLDNKHLGHHGTGIIFPGSETSCQVWSRRAYDSCLGDFFNEQDFRACEREPETLVSLLRTSASSMSSEYQLSEAADPGHDSNR